MVFDTDATGNVSAKVRIGVKRAQWQLSNAAGIYKTHGAYTILFDAKTNMPQDLINTTTPSFGWYAFPNGSQTGMSKNWSNPTTDTWVRDIELIADFDTASKAYFMFGVESIGDNSSATAYDFYYDNVRVYWKPFNVNLTIDANGDNQTYKWISSKFTGTAGAWEYDKAFTYDVDTAKHADFEYLYGIFFGYVGKATEQASYDNLRLYWKPYTANITINMNGNTDKTVEAYVNDTSSVLSLEALASHVGAETANYTLVGFSKTADGEVLTEDFWANEDITLYAIWEAKTVVTPESYDVSSIRTDAYTGIRFMSSVTAAQKAEVTEYGFIVTLVDLLGDKELTHDSGVTYVEGVNYDVEEGVDKIFNIEDDNIFFTAVVHGMPKTAVGYQTEFVVRPFTKRDGYYYYGAPVQRSICAVAEKIRDNNYADLSEAAVEVVKGILTTCGKSTESVSE